MPMDQKALLELYKETLENKRDFTDRAWETVKFFTTIISSLITITIGSALAYLKYFEDGSGIPLKIILIVLPGFIILVALIGHINLKRESKRYYEQIGILISVRELLGLNEKIPEDKRVFTDESYIFPERYTKSKGKYSTNKDFVEKVMKGKDTYYYLFSKLFQLYVAIGFFLVVCMVWIVL